MVLVFFPSFSELANNKLSYTEQLNAYKLKHPNACVIDTGPELLLAVKHDIKINAPHGHYNSAGNKIVAQEIVKGLQRCQKTKIHLNVNMIRQ
jgi:hypothetical protein